MAATMSFAQDRTVSGQITSSEDGSTLPGVNVVVKGTTQGGVTDIDGNYKITVPEDGGTLVFSFIGLESQEMEIGSRSIIDMQMASDVRQLSEVVVTAMGVEREKKALGYAVTTLGKEQIQENADNDIGRILNGKVAGVQVTATSGVAGTGTNIVIRGYTSISGSNQPLWIVDGVPFNSGTNSQGNFTDGALNTSSRFLDLDPNNIENMTVLKGLAATVKYGQQGRNGVIIVTTKTGGGKQQNQGFEMTLNQSVFATKIASLPNYQNTYGNGFHQNFGFFFSNWGPNFNQLDSVNHPLSALQDPELAAAFPEFQDAQYAYKPYDNVEEWFRTGISSTTSLNISGGNETSRVSANVTYANETGFTPGNELSRFNIGLGGSTQLSNRFSLTSSFNYAVTDMTTPPIAPSSGSNPSGDGLSIFANVFYTPRSVDLNGLPFESPVDNRSVYYRSGNDIQNPNWSAKYTAASNQVQRFYGKSGLKFDITDNLYVHYRLGIDTYSEKQEYVVNKGSVQNDDYINGLYRTTNITNSILNQDFIIGYNSQLSEDFHLTVLAGAQDRVDRFEQTGIESTNQLVFGMIHHSNFTTQSGTNGFTGRSMHRIRDEHIFGVYGDVSLDFRNFLFLNLQGRNDWASTLEQENRSIFYPSASLSFLPTEVFSGLQSNTLNYLKIRTGFGTSAGFPNPYRTRTLLSNNARGFLDGGGNPVSTNGVSNTLGNPNLRAELHQEIEVGVEARMFNNRLSVDLSLYRRTTNDLITTAPIDPATGFRRTEVNIGRIVNNGIELGMNYTVLQLNNGLTWDLGLNYFLYRTIVTDLGDIGLEEIPIAGFTNLGNFAIKDQPFSVMQGSRIARDDNGNRIVDATGGYLVDEEIGIIGDPNPDFNISFITGVSFKGFRLNGQFEWRQGGDVYATTVGTLLARGLTEDTNFDRDQSVILPGVLADGRPNDIQISPTTAYFSNTGIFFDELMVYDGTTLRLRELSLSYSLPSSLLEKLPFGNVSFTLRGENLWFNAVNMPKHTNFDTDVLSVGVGNGLGFDFLTGPSAKRFGGSVTITF